MPNYRTNPNYNRTHNYTAPLDISYDGMKDPYHTSGKQDDLAKLPLAMAYVPWQIWDKAFELDEILSKGTLFPGLYKPFLGAGGYRS